MPRSPNWPRARCSFRNLRDSCDGPDSQTVAGPRQHESRNFTMRHSLPLTALVLALASGVDAQVLDQKTELAIEALSRLSPDQINGNPKLKEALGKVVAATRGTPRFVQLVQQFGLKDQNAGLIEVAINNPSDEAGVAAARMVLASGDTGAIN